LICNKVPAIAAQAIGTAQWVARRQLTFPASRDETMGFRTLQKRVTEQNSFSQEVVLFVLNFQEGRLLMSRMIAKGVNGIATKRRFNKQQGLTLGESLLVLGVSALIAVSAYGAFRFANSDVAANDMGRGAVTLASQIKRTLGAAGSYSSVTATSIKDAGLVPSGWKHDGTDLRDNYGNVVAINGATSSFALAFQDMSAADCAKVISQFEGVAYKLNVGTAAGAAAGVISGGSVYKAADGTLTGATIASGCAEAGRKIAMEVR